MAYDVFVVSALEDRDMANLVVRRLRALKFKCWFDKKQTDTTFDQKDARNALNSQSMLVLWSKHAVTSDWVRAAASVGNSRPGMLVEVALDDTVPYEPFAINKRYKLEGMTTRTTVEGFYEIVDELGRRDGRKDLRDWLNFGKEDEIEKREWLASHPSDPLAIAESKKREKELGVKPAPAAAAAGAAALAASTVSGKAAAGGETAAARGEGPAERTTNDQKPEEKTAAAPASASAASASSDSAGGVIGSGYGEGVGKVPGTPGAPYKPGRKGPAGVYTPPPASAETTNPPGEPSSIFSGGLDKWMVPAILAAIALMLLLGYVVRTSPAQRIASAGMAQSTGQTQAARSEIIMAGNSCPAGYISSRSLAQLPEPDAKEAEEE